MYKKKVLNLSTFFLCKYTIVRKLRIFFLFSIDFYTQIAHNIGRRKTKNPHIQCAKPVIIATQ